MKISKVLFFFSGLKKKKKERERIFSKIKFINTPLFVFTPMFSVPKYEIDKVCVCQLNMLV